MKIQYSNRARKFLEKQDISVSQRIVNAIKKLPDNGDIKPMYGGEDRWRLRVGKYRVIYILLEDCIYIDLIGLRGEIYKGGKR